VCLWVRYGAFDGNRLALLLAQRGSERGNSCCWAALMHSCRRKHAEQFARGLWVPRIRRRTPPLLLPWREVYLSPLHDVVTSVPPRAHAQSQAHQRVALHRQDSRLMGSQQKHAYGLPEWRLGFFWRRRLFDRGKSPGRDMLHLSMVMCLRRDASDALISPESRHSIQQCWLHCKGSSSILSPEICLRSHGRS
jgi:hypothetical protein